MGAWEWESMKADGRRGVRDAARIPSEATAPKAGGADALLGLIRLVELFGDGGELFEGGAQVFDDLGG